MTPPKFITFTGVDDLTRVADLHILAARYPVEFGVLFSPKRQGGGGRYPALAVVQHVLKHKGQLRLAAHVCGGHSVDLISTGKVDPMLDQLLRKFDRIQVNTARSDLPLKRLQSFGLARGGLPIIVQARGAFPSAVTEVQWLFDASGGRGEVPKEWPRPSSVYHGSAVLKGYAGGLRPENVAKHVATIGEHDSSYWIDMETGVRDEHDRFSVNRCRAVCRAVFGD